MDLPAATDTCYSEVCTDGVCVGLPNGGACKADLQCTSSYCELNIDEGNGVCTERVAAGATCTISLQ